MENRSATFGITTVGVVVALVALAFRGTPTPATPVPAVVTSPAAAQSSSGGATPQNAPRESDFQFADADAAVASYSRGRRLIGEYFGTTWDKLVASDTGTRRVLPVRPALRVTIVTIPDPYDSHMDWSYDANLEALRRAMGTAGYVPQSFWLPQRADSIRVVTEGISVRYPAHDFQPGVFLFRATDPNAPALHVVYLIPEVPTSGIHMQAFRAALGERTVILAEGAERFLVDEREKVQLSVLGPNFSGSAMSLRRAIDNALQKGGVLFAHVGAGPVDAKRLDSLAQTVQPRVANVVSGSATSYANLQVLSDRSLVTVPRRGGPANDVVQIGRIRYAATVNPDEALDDVLRLVLKSLDVQPHQVAVLTESGTAYGTSYPGACVAPVGGPSDSASASDSTRASERMRATDSVRAQAADRSGDDAGDNAIQPVVQPCAGSANANSTPPGSAEPVQADTGSAATTPTDSSFHYLRVLFPLNIASLRREFAQAPAGSETGPAIPTLSEAPRTRLSLDEASRTRETPALTSSLSTPALDVVLEGLIHTLNEHDVRVVVIKATDVRDKLFLANELRRGVRDVVLVVYEGNVLLRRPEYADALRGALVLSSYPMSLENQFWTTAYRGKATNWAAGWISDEAEFVGLSDLLAFPTDAAVGTYNAALSLLGLPNLRVEYDLRNAFGSDSTYSRPPVWLTVVGRDGFYPLRADVPDGKWRSYVSPSGADLVQKSEAGARPHTHSDINDDVSLSLIIVVPALLILGLLAMFLSGHPWWKRMKLVLPDPLLRPSTTTESIFLALFVLSLSATYLPFSVAIDSRRIVASVDAYTGGTSLAMGVVIAIFLVIVGTGILLLVNGLSGFYTSPQPKHETSESLVEVESLSEPKRDAAAADAPANGSIQTPEPDADTGASGTTPPATSEQGAPDTRSVRGKVRDMLSTMRTPVSFIASGTAFPEDEDLNAYLEQTTRHESTRAQGVGLGIIVAVSLLFVSASLAYTGHLVALSRGGGIVATLAAYRALHLGSGVSPLLPLVLLGGGFAIWTWWQLQLVRTFDHPNHFESGMRQLAHAPGASALWRRAYRSIVDARRGLTWIFPGLGLGWVILAFLAFAWFIIRRRLPSIEIVADAAVGDDLWFDLALWLGILSLAISSAWAIYRLVFSWSALERFLDALSGTPLASAFARLPLDVVQLTNVGFLGFRRDDRNDRRFASELWIRARRDASNGAAETAGNALTSDLSAVLQKVKADKRCVESVAQAFNALRRSWDIARTRPDPVKDAPIELDEISHTQSRALRSLEEYVGCEIVLYIERYLVNLRRLCFFLFASLLILVAVGAQYPYQPHSIVSLVSVLLLGFTVVSVFFVMLRMSRNNALSRISRTEPGKVTWDTTLILNTVTFGVVPMLALATSEFPAVRAFLFSWADPVVRAVTRS